MRPRQAELLILTGLLAAGCSASQHTGSVEKQAASATGASEAKVVEGHVDASWFDQLHSWWLAHRYYPEKAARSGEQGAVVISLTVPRSGQVNELDLQKSSGFAILDIAAEATFRNAELPPLPPGTADDHVKVVLTINYILTKTN